VLPTGWMLVANFGVRQITTDANQIAANISLGEDFLQDENGLAEYIAKQAQLIGAALENPKLAGPQPFAFPNTDQSFLFMVRHTPGGIIDMLHVQTYVRVGLWVGIITLSTVEAYLKVVRPDYEAFLKGLQILPVTRQGS
jgi:hypothetical protein